MKDKNSISILFASRLVREKGVDILIESIEYSLRDPLWKDRVYWTICSDGEYVHEIVGLSERYSDHVSYLGKISTGELALLYREHDYLFMPSRFLETFGLTALESLASGTPVIGFSKGGVSRFIPESLSLRTDDPVRSLFRILEGYPHTPLDVSQYSRTVWQISLSQIFSDVESLVLIHDYEERIGGAEYSLERLIEGLTVLGKKYTRYSYRGSSSPAKRKILFITSLFTFSRYFSVMRVLRRARPDAIWLHSIARYVGFWGLLAVSRYSSSYHTRLYISHHDIGLFAPFPQDVYDEGDIPRSFSLGDFLSTTTGVSRVIAFFKWGYVALYRYLLPSSMSHILFAPFMEEHVRHHFGKDTPIILLPHFYDESIFHP